jgi:hypothetical protein
MKKEIRIRQQNASKFTSFRNRKIEDGVHATIGYLKDSIPQIQSFIFDPERFDSSKAKTWIKEYNNRLKESVGTGLVDQISPETKAEEESEGLDFSKENLDEMFDVKHASNGKINTDKVLTEIESLKKLEKHIGKKSYAKMVGFLKSKLKESYEDFLKDHGFNIVESENPIFADSFEIIPLQESVKTVKDSTVKRALVRLIKSGESKNRNVYTGKCLRDATPLFDGVPIYPNHVDDNKTNEDRSVTEKVGFYSDPVFVGDDENGEIHAVANILSSEPKIWDLVKEQILHPNAKLCGFSINAYGQGRKTINPEGKSKIIVDRIAIVDSTDIVSKPSAGGTGIQLLESIKNTIQNSTSLGEEIMDLEKLKESHADLVKQIEDEAKALALKEAEAAENTKMAKCPHCEKEFPLKESFEHTETHIKELNVKLTESLEKVKSLERSVAINSLTENVTKKLKEHANLPEATKKRLVNGLLHLGEETREGDKPSNWDLLIKEELDYANELKGSSQNLGLGSERTEVKKEETGVKLTEAEHREIAKRISI